MRPFVLRFFHGLKIDFILIIDVWKAIVIKVMCKNHFLRFSGYILGIIIAQFFLSYYNLRMSEMSQFGLKKMKVSMVLKKIHFTVK
jgi:hypothetical protein